MILSRVDAEHAVAPRLGLAQGAVDVVRGLAEDPTEQLTGRAASRELVTWEGGELTAREFVEVLRRLPPQQQAQYAAAPDDPIEGMLREVATNELVLADATERGITVPQEEQDSIRELIRDQLTQVAREAGLGGAPQEGETGTAAVERRVESLLQGILSGQQNLLPLGALPYVLRDEMDWQIYERAFPEVVEELQERRAGDATEAPLPPSPGMQDGTPPQGGDRMPPPDTTG